MYELASVNGVSLWHHGIKGMHWGIRRTPEELGHDPKAKSEKLVDNAIPKIIMVLGKPSYLSKKGFVIQKDKIDGYCLKPGGDHSKEFFDVGYKSSDGLKLFRHIENLYDDAKKIEEVDVRKGVKKYSTPMELGITKTKTFRVVWRTDGPEGLPRFVSAYVDRRLK